MAVLDIFLLALVELPSFVSVLPILLYALPVTASSHDLFDIIHTSLSWLAKGVFHSNIFVQNLFKEHFHWAYPNYLNLVLLFICIPPYILLLIYCSNRFVAAYCIFVSSYFCDYHPGRFSRNMQRYAVVSSDVLKHRVITC